MLQRFSENTLRVVVLLLLTVVLLPAQKQVDENRRESIEAQAAMKWLNPKPPSPVKRKLRIQDSRILFLSEEHRAEAVALLANLAAIPLSAEQQKYFTGGNARTGDEAIEMAITDALKEPRKPWAPPAGENIEYARSLAGKLKPYLVRGVVASPGNSNTIGGWPTLTVTPFPCHRKWVPHPKRALCV